MSIAAKLAEVAKKAADQRKQLMNDFVTGLLQDLQELNQEDRAEAMRRIGQHYHSCGAEMLHGYCTGKVLAAMIPQVHELQAALDKAEARIQELLALVVKVTNETPYPEELQGWEAQRRAFIAERGTLKARVAELESDLDRYKQGFEREQNVACEYQRMHAEAHTRIRALESKPVLTETLLKIAIDKAWEKVKAGEVNMDEDASVEVFRQLQALGVVP